MTTKAKKDYSKGKIYKVEPITDHEEGELYVGSTTKDYLSQRMVQHRSNYKRWINKVGYPITIFKLFDKYGSDNCQIILLEAIEANNYNELIAREAHYIRNLKCVNKVIPNRTEKEWRFDNIQEIRERRKEYRERNIEKLKEYYKNNKESIIEIQKQYYKDNKDKVKKYYEDNKDKIKEVKKEYESKIYKCDCGSICVLHKKARHLRTVKHQEYLKTSNLII